MTRRIKDNQLELVSEGAGDAGRDGCDGLGVGVAQVAHQGLSASMEEGLKGIVAATRVSADLTVTYDDMHGLWGGTIITVRGDGSVERQTRALGAPEVEVTRKQVDGRELVDVVRLLVELEAWKQRTAEEPPVADESRARLTISVGGRGSSVWERVKEMQAHDRLLRIKSRLVML